ncbi:MAG: hypothetical protein DRP65_00925 [Planctomycetota bacterium]|nr:MAG: hypothetical protein DRP65_00925 [Planctomycetota bacterium]
MKISVKTKILQKCCRIKSKSIISHVSQNRVKGLQKLYATKERSLADMPVVKISRNVCKEILHTVGSQPPESGGILLGPVGSNDVTGFFFDNCGSCTGISYSPDCTTLKQKMKVEWLPAGVDMKGFVHSHPGRLDGLSVGDMIYINRLLDINDDMPMFIAPIVIPQEFRMRPIVVLRDKPRMPREARLDVF